MEIIVDQVLAKAIKHWDHIAPLVAYPSNEEEFDQLVSRLNELLDVVGDDESHPLIGLVDISSNLISTYEEEHYPQL